MVKARRLTPLPFWDEEAVLAFFAERGWKPVHAYTLWKLTLRHRPKDVAELAQLSLGEHILLPGGLVEELAGTFALTTSTVVEVGSRARVCVCVRAHACYVVVNAKGLIPITHERTYR